MLHDLGKKLGHPTYFRKIVININILLDLVYYSFHDHSHQALKSTCFLRWASW